MSAMLGLTVAAKTVDAHIVAASLFKNGYAVVLRDVAIPGPGSYDLTSFPQASIGTLWFAATDGTDIDAVRTVTRTSTFMNEVTATDQLLQANRGHEVTLGLGAGDSVTGRSVEGKLLTIGENVILKTSHGTVVVPRGSITSISSASDLNYVVPGLTSAKGLEFKTSGKAGHISMLSLESGLTWSPAYAVDISDKNKLSLIAKATVVNDLEDMNGAEARFVTGFPNVPFATWIEPLVSGQSLMAFLDYAKGATSAGIVPGTFRGRGRADGISGAFTNQMAAAPAAEMGLPGTGMTISPEQGQQLEDLFFYRQPNVTLQRGDRAYYVLFRAEAPYKEVYTWDVADPVSNNFDYRNSTDMPLVPDDVWHTLEFKNTSGRPLTTAVATTLQKGQILGQDMMSYVPVNGDAELKITKALDVRAESSEEEVSRERGAIKFANNTPQFDLVTLKGTLQATNTKKEPVTLRIRHPYTGELISEDGDPTIKKTARGLRDTNPTGTLTWNKTVAAGDKLTLTYTYKLYVHSQ